MRLSEAIREVISRTASQDVVVHANGYIGRESHALEDRPLNFYMVGSMGLASSIALGIALADIKRRVIILDGDGNLLMNLGTLAQIGSAYPKNLIHIVLDNKSYASTGGQRTISASVPLDSLAKASGYPVVIKAGGIETLGKAFETCLSSEGPCFILAEVEAGGISVGRVAPSPREITERMRSALKRIPR